MDEEVTPLKRVWCILEIHTVIQTQKRFDVLAMVNEGEQTTRCFGDVAPGAALHMDLGNGRSESIVEHPRGWFPGKVALKGVKVQVSAAQAP